MAEARLSDGVSGISSEVAEQAVEWLVELQSDDCTDATRSTFQHWYQASAAHQRAWQRIEAVNGQMHGLVTPVGQAVARASLCTQHSGRRRALKALVVLFFGTGLLGYGWRRGWHSDYSSAVGEIAEHQLDDGTRFALNSDSAINVSYETDPRRIKLLRGELSVEMPAADGPSLQVATAEGVVHAMKSAAFLVNQYSQRTLVSLFTGELQLQTYQGESQILMAGEQCLLSRDAISTPQPLPAGTGAWRQGMLVASNMRLDRFLQELGRYRNGVLRCDPEIADRRVSGTYPLQNSDQAIAAVARVLQLEVRQLTPLWVSLHAA